MPAQNKRRPGFSRKAQYGLFASYVIAVLGMLVGLLLVITAWIDPQGSSAIRAAITDVTSPISRTLRSLVRGSGSIGTSISDYFDAASKNAAMRRELDATRQKLIAARSAEYENRRLKRLLAISETDAVITAARLVSSSGSSTRRYAILDKGSTSGIRHGQPVRGATGLVGTIVEVGVVTARVLLITDPGNVVPVIRISDGLPAIASGHGDGTIEIRSLNAGQNTFKTGDIFVTSGTGGVYAPQIPVAIAIRTQGDSAVGRPLADPSKLDFAIVQPVFQPQAAAPVTPAEPAS
jgi:rod shape-determining protein MreC